MWSGLFFFQSNVPLQYWSDCVRTSVFLIKTPSPLLQNKTPFEIIKNKPPDYSLLKDFGCLCSSSTYPKDRHKLTPRSNASVFLGYPSGYKSYKVLNLETNSISNFLLPETFFFMKTFFLFSPLSLMILFLIFFLLKITYFHL